MNLQRGQHGKVVDCWDLKYCNGQHSEGVYTFFKGDVPMSDYYTKNKELLHNLEIPDNLVKDLSYKKWDYWEAKEFIYKNNQYKAFVFRHSGFGIPTSKEILITDQSIITVINPFKIKTK
jgi:hypothetical protein